MYTKYCNLRAFGQACILRGKMSKKNPSMGKGIKALQKGRSLQGRTFDERDTRKDLMYIKYRNLRGFGQACILRGNNDQKPLLWERGSKPFRREGVYKEGLLTREIPRRT